MENMVQEIDVGRKKQPKLSSDKALPAVGVDKLLLVLKGYVIASSEGATATGYKEVASLTNMHPTEVAKNNSFLEESGLLKFVRRGQYLPVQGVIQYVKEEPWDKEQAKSALRPIIEETWYAYQIKDILRVQGIVTQDQAIKALGRVASAPASRRKDIEHIIELMIETGVLTRQEDNSLAISSTPSPAPVEEATTRPLPNVSLVDEALSWRSSETSVPTDPIMQATKAVGGVILNLTLNVPDSIDDLYLEQLAKLLKLLGYNIPNTAD